MFSETNHQIFLHLSLLFFYHPFRILPCFVNLPYVQVDQGSLNEQLLLSNSPSWTQLGKWLLFRIFTIRYCQAMKTAVSMYVTFPSQIFGGVSGRCWRLSEHSLISRLLKMKGRAAQRTRSRIYEWTHSWLGFLPSVFPYRSKVVTSTQYWTTWTVSISILCPARREYLAAHVTLKKKKKIPFLWLAFNFYIFRFGNTFSSPSTQHVYFYSPLTPSKLQQNLFPGNLRSENCQSWGKKSEETCDAVMLAWKHCPRTKAGVVLWCFLLLTPASYFDLTEVYSSCPPCRHCDPREISSVPTSEDKESWRSHNHQDQTVICNSL